MFCASLVAVCQLFLYEYMDMGYGYGYGSMLTHPPLTSLILNATLCMQCRRNVFNFYVAKSMGASREKLDKNI